MNRPRKHVDLSILNLDSSPIFDYVPPKATDPIEIARRRLDPPGTLILRDQSRGIKVANDVANFQFASRDAQTQAFSRLAVALTNSSWYSSGKDAQDVMRRVMDLPELADDHTEWREDREGMLFKIRNSLGLAALQADKLVSRHRQEKSHLDLSRRFARTIGSAGIRMACLHLTPTPQGLSAVQAQDQAWQIALSMIEQSRYSYESFDTHLSVAMLADGRHRQLFSDAPEETLVAFDQAFDDYS